MLTIAERVQRGVERLDEANPGWRELINIDTFNMDSLSKCILAQVFGSFGEGQEALYGAEITGEDLGAKDGFDMYSYSSPPCEGDSFYALQNEWKKVLRQ